MGGKTVGGRQWTWAKAGAVSLVALLLTVAAACGQPAPPPAGAEGQRSAGTPSSGSAAGEPVEVIMDEFSFTPVPLTLPAGRQVELTIRNQGAVVHEFMLGRGPKADGGYETDLLARAQVEVVAGEDYELEGFGSDEGHGAEIVVGSGGYVTLKLTLPADANGEWEVGCFIPGHYAAGMKGPVIVK